jgi:fumarate reductase flavoprotein subunit
MLQLIRPDGVPVPGIYIAGELLGAGQLMGSAFCGGMMGTPALTFGRLLGDRLLKFA